LINCKNKNKVGKKNPIKIAAKAHGKKSKAKLLI
jgi:hypothetical protein